MRNFGLFLLVFSDLTLSACAGSGAGPLGLGAIIGDRNLAAAEPLFSKQEQQCFDSGDQFATAIFGPVNSPTLAAELERKSKKADCSIISASFRHVLAPTVSTGPINYTQQQRNELIDLLIATSNRKCTRYIAMLKNADGAINSSLSISAIITAGLGSFVGGEATAKALSGSAAILSGSREAINQTYLSNLTIHVLGAAIEKARTRIRRDITNRQDCTTNSYSLSRGIEDAFQYHGACSISVGLAETAIAVERSQNPGLDAMRNSLADYAAFVKQVDEIGKPGLPTSVAGKPRILDLTAVTAINADLSGAQAQVDQLMAELDAATSKAKADVAMSDAKPADIALKTAADTAKKAEAGKLRELQTAQSNRDALAKQFSSELQKLASNVASTTPVVVAPESRTCPFGAGK